VEESSYSPIAAAAAVRDSCSLVEGGMHALIALGSCSMMMMREEEDSYWKVEEGICSWPERSKGWDGGWSKMVMCCYWTGI
jgi:hypothetical protein